MPKTSKQDDKKRNDNVLEQLRKLAKEHNKKQKESKDKDRKRKEKKHRSEEKSMTPMTKEDYEKKRSIIKTEYDPDTGRMRRVRATGEILESIVTREQHQRINKMSTFGDGLSYSKNLFQQAKKM